MENKEVEAMLNSIKVEYALLEGKLYYQSKDVEEFLADNQSLTEQVRGLKQELQAKDKALDKATPKAIVMTNNGFVCPTCGDNIKVKLLYAHYCNECGQRLE